MNLRPKDLDNDNDSGADAIWDYWSFEDGKSLKFDVTNPDSSAKAFYIKLDEGNPIGSGNATSVVYSANVPANSTSSFFLSAGGLMPQLCMRELPPSPGGTPANFAWGKTDINLKHITQITFWMMYVKQDTTLIFDDIKFINDPSSDLSYMNNIVDQYGQYTKQTWPGKVTSDADLTSNAISEATTLDTQIQEIEDMNKYTQYGGWKNESLKQEATGRFYVKKVDGKWTYIDPEGYPFISTGLDISYNFV